MADVLVFALDEHRFGLPAGAVDGVLGAEEIGWRLTELVAEGS